MGKKKNGDRPQVKVFNPLTAADLDDDDLGLEGQTITAQSESSAGTTITAQVKSLAGTMSEEQVRDIFAELDQKSTGQLDVADFREVMAEAGQPCRKKDVAALMAEVSGSSSARSVGVDKFVRWYMSAPLDHFMRDHIRKTHGLTSAVRPDEDLLSEVEVCAVFEELDVTGTASLTGGDATALLHRMQASGKTKYATETTAAAGKDLIRAMSEAAGGLSDSELSKEEFLLWYKECPITDPVRDFIRTEKGLFSAIRDHPDTLSPREIMEVFNELDISNSKTLRSSDLGALLFKMKLKSGKAESATLLNKMARAAGEKGKVNEITGKMFVAWYEQTSMDHPVRNYIRMSKGLSSAVRDDPDKLSSRELLETFDDLDVSCTGSLTRGDIRKFCTDRLAKSTMAQELEAEMRAAISPRIGDDGDITPDMFISWYWSVSLDHPARDYIRKEHGLTSAIRDDPDVMSTREIIEVFVEFDTSGSGTLELPDIRSLLTKMRQPADKGSGQILLTDMLIAGGQPMNSNSVTQTSFVSWYQSLPMDNSIRDFIRGSKGLSTESHRSKRGLQDRLNKKALKKIQDAFDRIDVDKSGTIEAPELKLMMMEMGKQHEDSDIEKMMLELDSDGDGKVTIEEFRDWWISTEGTLSVIPVDAVKELAFSPCLIFFHLFDANSDWFLTMGAKGIPFALIGDTITWALNFFQLVFTIAAVMETMKDYSSEPDRNPEDYEYYESLWYGINMGCTLLFLAEWTMILVGSIVVGKTKEIVADPMWYIDGLSIFSGVQRLFYTRQELGMWDMRYLRILRLTKLLSTLKNERINSLAPVVWQILVDTTHALLAPVFLMVLMLVICSSLCYFAEMSITWQCELHDGTIIDDWTPTIDINPGCLEDDLCLCAGVKRHVLADGEVVDSDVFSSIPLAMWWCLVTMTTVGYGDVYPRTPMGQTIGAVTSFLGLLTIAMPISIVGGTFHLRYSQLEEKLQAKKALMEERVGLTERLKGARMLVEFAGHRVGIDGYMEKITVNNNSGQAAEEKSPPRDHEEEDVELIEAEEEDTILMEDEFKCMIAMLNDSQRMLRLVAKQKVPLPEGKKLEWNKVELKRLQEKVAQLQDDLRHAWPKHVCQMRL